MGIRKEGGGKEGEGVRQKPEVGPISRGGSALSVTPVARP